MAAPAVEPRWEVRDRTLQATSCWILVPGALALLKRDWLLAAAHGSAFGCSWRHWQRPADAGWQWADRTLVTLITLRSLHLAWLAPCRSYLGTAGGMALAGGGYYSLGLAAESEGDVIGDLAHHSVFRYCFYYTMVYGALSRFHSFRPRLGYWAAGVAANVAAYAGTLLVPLQSVASADSIERFASEAAPHLLLPILFVACRAPGRRLRELLRR